MERKLYYHGNILTMERQLYAQAVLTEDGTIAAVGELEAVKAAAKEVQMVDLEGRTLMRTVIFRRVPTQCFSVL